MALLILLLRMHRCIIAEVFNRVWLMLPELLPIAAAQGQHGQSIGHINGAVGHGRGREQAGKRNLPVMSAFPVNTSA